MRKYFLDFVDFREDEIFVRDKFLLITDPDWVISELVVP